MIKIKTNTTVKSEKLNVKKFLENLRNVKGSFVSIGIHEDAGKYTDGENPPSVVEVGLWNEFGTETSPERSFIRSAINENESLINKWREEAIHNMMLKGWDISKALEMIGFRIMTLVQNKIKSNVPPKLADSTIAEKARHGVGPMTLIDTTLMLRSITYKVVIK